MTSAPDEQTVAAIVAGWLRLPWIRTLRDIVGLLTVTIALDWLFDVRTGMSGFAAMIAISALVQAYRVQRQIERGEPFRKDRA